MDSETIYLAALFHDIGKLIERSKLYDNKKVSSKYSEIRYPHAKYTAFFLETYLKLFNWLKKDDEQLQEFIDLAAYHHNPKDIYGKIIQLADWLASSEREKDEGNKDLYNTVQLKSIFGKAFDENIERYYSLFELDMNLIFPFDEEKEKSKERYKLLANKMTENIKRVQNKEEILYFWEKFFSFIPAQTTGNEPDISLFDHSKLTAALAICLYQQLEAGKLDEKKLNNYLKSIDNLKNIQDEHFIFIKGDLSGIQNFIFSISSKGAAKSLKGRSIFLTILMDAVAKYIIKELDLELANIIYNGGGNFYILAPESKIDKLNEIKSKIYEIFFKNFKTDIICNLAYTKIKMSEFGPFKFKDVWLRISNVMAMEKQKPLIGILSKNYDELFKPKELIYNDAFCSVCHSTKNVRKYEDLDDLRLCETCYSFKHLTEEVARAKIITFFDKKNKNEGFYQILNALNYHIKFKNNLNNTFEDDYVINEFGNKKTLKWRLGAYNLPIDKTTDAIKTFEHLAGENKLAYLKLDVDNLGALFTKGLNNPTLSRISVLSRMLKLFFEGYLPVFINGLKKSDVIPDKKFDNSSIADEIYIVYSGGDDTLLIGNLEVLLYFAKKLRDEFKKFVAFNPKITFSAGLGFFNPSFPIIKAVEETEHYLSLSKELKYLNEAEASKDKITILGETFSWGEYSYVLELYSELKKEITKNSHGFSKSHLQKIIRSTAGWKPLLDLSQNGKLSTQKVWRLRYFLRNLTNKDNIIQVYEDMWFKNFYKSEDKKIKNHQIITVAAKLADLNTREKS